MRTRRAKSASQRTAQRIFLRGKLEWRQVAPGMQMAVIAGDARLRGRLYIVRFKLTKGFVHSVHWHPQDELFKVLKGTMGLGFGKTFDRRKAKILKPGCYGWVPAKVLHYTWSDGPSVLEVQGIGPFDTIPARSASDGQGRGAKLKRRG